MVVLVGSGRINIATDLKQDFSVAYLFFANFATIGRTILFRNHREFAFLNFFLVSPLALQVFSLLLAFNCYFHHSWLSGWCVAWGHHIFCPLIESTHQRWNCWLHSWGMKKFWNKILYIFQDPSVWSAEEKNVVCWVMFMTRTPSSNSRWNDCSAKQEW